MTLSPADVCLVSMPYAAVERPSIALGLLHASLRDTGLSAKSLYPNVWFAREIGLRLNQLLCDSDAEMLLGEWTFSAASFPDFKPEHGAYVDAVARAVRTSPRARKVLPAGQDVRQMLYGLRDRATTFVNRVAEAILARKPRIVGCTSIFQQHCASLALLRRIRELAPEVVTLLGGANCEGPMGRVTAREFHWVDFVVSGEADELFPQLCRLLVDEGRQEAARKLPYGVIPGRALAPASPEAEDAPAPRATIKNMNTVPTPEYDDYFETLREFEIMGDVCPGLVMETSRGCWWGAKHHCTFCGLNGAGMEHRDKAPERVLRELAMLSERHGIRRFETVDNILTMSYFNTVVPALAALPEPYTLFYETKSNLRRDHVKLLSDAGIRWIQPGIEGLHDEALKLVDKGCTALGNIQLMKWAREYGVRLSWFILVMLPGESDAWHATIAQWVPLVEHLQPPLGVTPIQFHRFSPYFTRAKDFGLSLVPKPSYASVYPLPPEGLQELAYYFDDRGVRTAGPGLQALGKKVMAWQYAWRREMALINDNTSTDHADVEPPLLRSSDDGTRLRFTDTRYCATAPTHELSGVAYHVYKCCDTARTPVSIAQALQTELRVDVSKEEIAAALEDIKVRKLALFLDGKVLSLAVRAESYRGVPAFDFPGGYLTSKR